MDIAASLGVTREEEVRLSAGPKPVVAQKTNYGVTLTQEGNRVVCMTNREFEALSELMGFNSGRLAQAWQEGVDTALGRWDGAVGFDPNRNPYQN